MVHANFHNYYQPFNSELLPTIQSFQKKHYDRRNKYEPPKGDMSKVCRIPCFYISIIFQNFILTVTWDIALAFVITKFKT